MTYHLRHLLIASVRFRDIATTYVPEMILCATVNLLYKNAGNKSPSSTGISVSSFYFTSILS